MDGKGPLTLVSEPYDFHFNYLQDDNNDYRAPAGGSNTSLLPFDKIC